MTQKPQSPRVSPSQQADGFRERRVANTLRHVVDMALDRSGVSQEELRDELRRELDALRATNPNGWGRA